MQKNNEQMTNGIGSPPNNGNTLVSGSTVKKKKLIGRLKIGKLSIVVVLRHRWEKKEHPLDNYGMWKDYKIGFWFRKSKAVGRKDFKEVSKWSKNLKSTYMVGFDFLFVKMWIDVDYGVMHLEV